MKLNLSTKANTLEQLQGKLSIAKVLPLIKFTLKEYSSNSVVIINECCKTFDTDLIVRSSSIHEDNFESSFAGHFESILNVKCKANDIKKAIDTVIDSYGMQSDENNEVFIQPMLESVIMSGVVFTSDMDTLSPYYCINYDETGNTTNVTSGQGKDLQTLFVFKEYPHNDIKIQKLLDMCKECETLFNNKFLDIEFAFTNENLYVLQVRAIVKKDKMDLSNINLSNSLHKLYKKIQKLNSSHPKLLGTKSIFGVMPDWNPAEIIGVKPKRLALSLYKEIITDDIWAYQRDNYGYRNLRSFPLMVSFLGVPFIDVRISFNSFIPKNLHPNIASKLVEYYLTELASNTTYHDKIEFEIVHSCYYFGIEKKLNVLQTKGFSHNEIKRIEFELLEITNKIIDVDNGLYKKDLNKVELLKEKYHAIVNSNLSLIDKVYWLIEDCKRYGTLPFAGVARAAFVAVQFLNSFVEEKILTLEEKEAFLNSIETVSRKLNQDKIEMLKEEFLELYGHLRPGTYDICSLRYDQAYDKYFSNVKGTRKNKEFIFSKNQKNRIKALIIENGLQVSCKDLIQFIKESIEGREYAKFIFTKHLSKVLLLINEFGNKFGFSSNDLAHLDIQTLKNLYTTLDHRDVVDILNLDIQKNKEFYEYTQAVKLPSIIINESDIYSFKLEQDEASFVTLKSITADIVNLENEDDLIEGKIVCIVSADPGYDYLFSQNIGGLITCYGGANSHMAIRCAELGIPAVIGCGEKLFNKYVQAHILNIDSANKQVKIIS